MSRGLGDVYKRQIWELIIINLVEIIVMALLVVGLTEWRVHMSFDKEGNRK